jgi:hypothetical protein
MNEKTPYEEQLDRAWDELPLPNEDMAWKDMKRRLDEDDDDKIIAPPPRSGCGIGALLIGLLLFGGFWFLLRPEKWFTKKENETAQQTKRDVKENKTEVKTENNSSEVEGEIRVKQDQNIDKITQKDTANTQATIDNPNEQERNKIGNKNSHIKSTTKGSELLTIKDEVTIQTNDPATKKKKANIQPVKANRPKNASKVQNKKAKKNNIDERSVSSQKKKQGTEDVLNNKVPIQQKDSVITDARSQQPQINTLPVTDSLKNKMVQSTAPNRKDSVVKNKNIVKEKDKEQRPIFFSAGLGMHQQIPIAGQEWVTYNSLGRIGILSDYIPSINFRMEKQDRWFLQTEFRYGAPQHTKQFTYEQVIKFDTASQSTITNSSVLKKTFYHQVPLTFNYYVLPNWSIGTGIQWNKFYSAVAEQDVKRRRLGTNNDSLLSQEIVKVNADTVSAFAKSWFQGIIQTQYHWKHFSIGVKYSFGLQPYIKFTLPNQPLQEEKNSSFQIFLRYEVWRSKIN